MKHARWSAALLIVLAAIYACDPAVAYMPRGAARVDERRWSVENDDLRIVFSAPRPLIGATSIAPEPDVTNRTAVVLTLKRAALITSGRRIEGQFDSGGPRDIRSIDAHATNRVPVFFDFDDPAPDVLGREFSLVIDYESGGSERAMSVTFVRR